MLSRALEAQKLSLPLATAPLRRSPAVTYCALMMEAGGAGEEEGRRGGRSQNSMTRLWLVLNKHDVMLRGFAAGRGID